MDYDQDYEQAKLDQAAAEERNKKLNLMGLVGDALSGMTSAGSIASGIAPQKSTALENYAQQVAKTDNPLEKYKNTLAAYKAAKDAKTSDLDLTAKADELDPNSKVSEATRQAYAPILARNGTDPSMLASMSANDIKKYVQNPLEFNQKDETNRIARAQIGAWRGQVQANKDDAKQNKDLSTLREKMETFRGNKAAQQAAQDVYSADKTLAMVNGKDPNSLTTQDLSLLASEMAKIATGGIPSEHGVQQLMPNNLSTKAAELQSFLTSKPSDAQAADYIKKNMAYLKEMSGEAKKTLGSYRMNIAKGYKKRVNPDDYQEVMDDYGLSAPADAPLKVTQSSANPVGPATNSWSENDEKRLAELEAKYSGKR